jgi:cytochrome P450
VCRQLSVGPGTYHKCTPITRIGWHQGVTLSPFGPRHRKYRKLLNSTLNSTAARKLWPIQESGVYRFLVRLADDPVQFYEHIRTSVSETIVSVTFGQECSKDNFPYIEMAERTQHAFSVATTPYSYAVDILPIRACFISYSMIPGNELHCHSAVSARMVSWG